MAPEKIRVFLIGDSPLERDCVKLIIDQQPDLLVCGEAEDLGTASEAISEAHPDVIVIHLPSRISLLTKLKEQHSALSVIAIVNEEGEDAIIHALRAGASGIVKARDTSENLLHAIRAAKEGNVYLSEPFVAVVTRHIADVGRANKSGNPAAKDLSTREYETFALLGEGKTVKKIAQMLGLSISTVQAYCVRIRRKRGFKNHFELIQAATRSSR
jgi:DNA-binding NarL/FixJ family response regulator